MDAVFLSLHAKKCLLFQGAFVAAFLRILWTYSDFWSWQPRNGILCHDTYLTGAKRLLIFWSGNPKSDFRYTHYHLIPRLESILQRI